MPTTTTRRPTTSKRSSATKGSTASEIGPSVELQQRAPEHALAVRTRTQVTAIPGVMADVLPEVWHVAEQLGCRPIMPFARYLAFEMPEVDFEAGCLVDGPVEHGLGRVEAITLPGGELAVATHVGPYERLSETYGAVERWLGEQGRVSHGAMWEVYLDDPGTTPPDRLRTEVVVPLD
jgi:AraC family transcriptional regulator